MYTWISNVRDIDKTNPYVVELLILAQHASLTLDLGVKTSWVIKTFLWLACVTCPPTLPYAHVLCIGLSWPKYFGGLVSTDPRRLFKK